jgi:hypothetical protein
MKANELRKKPSPEEYYSWLADRCREEVEGDSALGETSSILHRQQEMFNNHVEALRVDFVNSQFWQQLCETIIEKHYRATSGGLLAHPNRAPVVLKKPWDSLILKSFRRNILNNEEWPDQPAKGWTIPGNWFERIADLIRTTIVVRYLDGIEPVHEAIEVTAKALDIKCRFDYENREEGYYALHSTVSFPFRFRREGYRMETRPVPVEIQVCTQVQEVLRALTHRTYEIIRRKPKAENVHWQWRWNCEQFTPNYLGHILHYADGVMLNLRDGLNRSQE